MPAEPATSTNRSPVPPVPNFRNHLLNEAQKTGCFARLAHHFQRQAKPTALQTLADSLGVSVESLHKQGVGYDPVTDRWTFPEYDQDEQVIGIVCRHAITGDKRALPGSRNRFIKPVFPCGVLATMLMA